MTSTGHVMGAMDADALCSYGSRSADADTDLDAVAAQDADDNRSCAAAKLGTKADTRGYERS